MKRVSSNRRELTFVENAGIRNSIFRPKRALQAVCTLIILLLSSLNAASAQDAEAGTRTEVVILGVDHSAQLINRKQQAGALRAFFDTIDPAAICIERAPERVARSDHYEFTYEIQDVIIPWAREKGLPLCPFDWLPSAEDSALALGIADLEAPPAIRRDEGFQGFLSFPDPESRTTGLFFADRQVERAKHRQFYAAYPEAPSRDMARRLFLYRTFMQARRIAAAARNYPGKRIVVVVGTMHKDDIEKILSDDLTIRVVQPSAMMDEPGPDKIAEFTRWQDLAAIASFNLLGAQGRAPNLDQAWMAEVVEQLRKQHPGAESDLFAAKLAEISGGDASAALRDYLRIAKAARDDRFTWTGVKDKARIDSYFDPFGNLPVVSRALLEAARIHASQCRQEQAAEIHDRISRSLGSELKSIQFKAYWARYIMPDQRNQGVSQSTKKEKKVC